jgi:hypothetical protein
MFKMMVIITFHENENSFLNIALDMVFELIVTGLLFIIFWNFEFISYNTLRGVKFDGYIHFV